ncbi:hypothetical protein [Nocardioides sp. HB32]
MVRTKGSAATAQLMSMEDLIAESNEHPHRHLATTIVEGDGPTRPAEPWLEEREGDVPPWTMKMQTDDGHTDHEGEKEDLLRIAHEAGVTDEHILIYDGATNTWT